MGLGIAVTGLEGKRICSERATIRHFGKIIQKLDREMKEKRRM